MMSGIVMIVDLSEMICILLPNGIKNGNNQTKSLKISNEHLEVPIGVIHFFIKTTSYHWIEDSQWPRLSGRQ